MASRDRWTTHCDGQRIGSAATDMPKPVAIVAAMRSELGALLRGVTKRTRDGVELYELPSALVAIGGIGRKPALALRSWLYVKRTPRLWFPAGLAGRLRRL